MHDAGDVERQLVREQHGRLLLLEHLVGAGQAVEVGSQPTDLRGPGLGVGQGVAVTVALPFDDRAQPLQRTADRSLQQPPRAEHDGHRQHHRAGRDRHDALHGVPRPVSSRVTLEPDRPRTGSRLLSRKSRNRSIASASRMLRSESGTWPPTSAACAALNHASTAARWVSSNAAYLVRFSTGSEVTSGSRSMVASSAETWPRLRR